MASPQKENGYTAIANEIIEALVKHKFGAGEYKIIFYLLRKTYGFHKKNDAISLTEFARETGQHWVHCSKILKRLLLAKVLTLSNNAKGLKRSYCFQKDYDKWRTLSKYAKGGKTLSNNAKRPLATMLSEPLAQLLYTKDRVKETSKEKISSKEDIAENPPICPDPRIRTMEKIKRETSEFIKFYCILYRKRYNTVLKINGKASGIAMRMVKDLGLATAMDLLQVYLSMNERWFITRGHDLPTFESNLNKIQVKKSTGRTITQDVAKELETRDENRESMGRVLSRIENEEDHG